MKVEDKRLQLLQDEQHNRRVGGAAALKAPGTGRSSRPGGIARSAPRGPTHHAHGGRGGPGALRALARGWPRHGVNGF